VPRVRSLGSEKEEDKIYKAIVTMTTPWLKDQTFPCVVTLAVVSTLIYVIFEGENIFN